MFFGHFTRIYFGFALCFSIQVIALSQTSAPNPGPGTASISGRVTIGGKPAAGKKILIADVNTGWGTPDVASSGNGTQGRKFIAVATGADGQYRLAGLPAGKYEATVDLLGSYAPVGELNQRSRPITLRDGEEAKNIDFALVRGGVISGRLTSADGNPIIGARVLASPADESVKRNTLYYRSGVTDDRSVYRIYGLPAGRYLVSADGSEHGPNASSLRNSGRRFGQTYHPKGTDETGATVVEVKEGSEAAGVDINLGQRRALYEVTGRVIDSETGKPLSGGAASSYLLRPDGYHAESFSISAVIDSDGNFRFAGLPSGRYGVETGVEGDYYSEKTIIEVKQAKVSNLEIKVKRSAAIKGRVVVDPSSNRALINQLPGASITAGSTYNEGDVTGSGSYGSSEIGMDGSFSFSALRPGVITLGIGGARNGPSPHLLRIERNDVEVPNGLEIKAGETIDGIRLVVVYGSGVIRGQIKMPSGAAPEGVLIVTAQKSNPYRYSAQARTNSKGQFYFEGLMDGEYSVVTSLAPGSGTGPTLLASQLVQVTGGKETSVTLTLNPIK